MINIEPKVIFKFDQLWRWLSPLTTAAAKGGKKWRSTQWCKNEAKRQRNKAISDQETAQLSPPSDQAILISLAFGLPRSISQLKSQNWRSSCQAQSHLFQKHQGGNKLFWNCTMSYCNVLSAFYITPLLDWNSNIWRKILPNLATHAAKYSFIQNWSLYLFCKWKFMLTWEIIDHFKIGRERWIFCNWGKFSGNTPNSFGDCLWRHVEDWAPGGKVFFWLENFIRGSTPVSGALSTIIALHFTNT